MLLQVKNKVADDPQQQLVLTHHGQTIDESYFNTTNEASDDKVKFYKAALSCVDTYLHFGGPVSSTTNQPNNNNSVTAGFLIL
jgi:hypothetical protein